MKSWETLHHLATTTDWHSICISASATPIHLSMLSLPCEQDSWTPPLRAVLIPDPEWARHPLPAGSHHFATPSNSVLKNYELNWWQRAAIVGSKPPETMGADVMPTIPTKFLLPLYRNWMARIKILDNLYSRSTTHRNPPGTRFFSTKQKTCGLFEQPPPTLSQSLNMFVLTADIAVILNNFLLFKVVWEQFESHCTNPDSECTDEVVSCIRCCSQV